MVADAVHHLTSADGYRSRVHVEMDVDRITIKLKRSEYASPHEVAADVHQVWYMHV